MLKVSVLGAGYMGSAITFPLSHNGIPVNLWGTWLDGNIIDSCRKGYHPKLKKALPDSVHFYNSEDLLPCVEDADLIIIAVTSEGFLSVYKKLLECSNKSPLLITLTKGFAQDNGEVKRLSETAQRLFKERFPCEEVLWVSVGGPVKAVELSNKVPTVTVFGINNQKIKDVIGLFATDYYRVSLTDDVIGVELASAFKNVYAIALGISNSIYQSLDKGHCDNLNAFLFNQAANEMALIIEAGGGRRDTVFDLAGIGDLYVTSQSGRNRKFGDYIGRGVSPKNAYKMMLEEGEVAEGYNTLSKGMIYLRQLGKGLLDELPLFQILYRTVFEERDFSEELKAL